ncbi:hypothetical protein D3C86_2233250 [compost metagenome]
MTAPLGSGAGVLPERSRTVELGPEEVRLGPGAADPPRSEIRMSWMPFGVGMIW